MNLTIHGCNLNWTNKNHTLGWSSNSLYKHFDSAIINHIPLQVPYLVLNVLEQKSKLDDEPYVDDFLWAGGLQKMPEVNLSLNVYIQNLTFNSTEYRPWSDYFYYTLSDCPSDKIVISALEELNQWVRVNNW